MQTVVLETLTDYEEVMDEIEALIDIDPCPDSCDGKRLLALAEAVAAYERRKFGWLSTRPTENDWSRERVGAC